MIWTFYDNAFDHTPKVLDLTWPEFVGYIGPHTERNGVYDKRLLPAFSPAELLPGTTRLNGNVARLHAAVIDLDGISSEQLRIIFQACEGLACLFYTTWRHPEHPDGPGLWRLRLVVPLSRPVEASEWPALWPAILRRLCAPGDTHCKDKSRVYFGAFAAPGTLSEHVFHVLEGAPLDPGSLAVNVALNAIPISPAALETIPRERLKNLARSWKRSRDETRQHLGLALERLEKGEAFAEPGNRDNTLFQLTRDLIRTWPNADPESLAAHFAQALAVMGPDAPSPETVRDKLQRAQQAIALERAQAEQAALEETKTRIRQAFEPYEPGRDWPYTVNEIDDLCRDLKVTREELTYRWIIQRGTSFYILGPGGYSKPYHDKEATNAALRDLSPAESAGVELWQVSEQGVLFRKTLSQLMEDYGTVASTSVADLRAQRARYDSAAQTYIEAPAPIRRDLKPEFDAEVATWLLKLSGPLYPDVCNWLALSTDLNVTCVALILTGPGDSGKNLFAHGVGRTFNTTQPTSLEQALGGFNDALLSNPVVFADEQLPKDFKGGSRTAEIREFIGTLSRPLKRKFHPDSVLLGAIRLVVASNNPDVLAFNENLSPDDIGAIGSRFLHVQIPKLPDGSCPASDYLKTVDAASFVTRDRLAKFALWLRDNFPITREGRFQIKTANQRATIEALSTKGGIRSSLCHWLVSYLRQPARVDSTGAFLVRIHKGRLLVNPQGVLESWSTFLPNEPAPTVGRIASACANLSSARVQVVHPKSKQSVNYRVIDPAYLRAWAENTEISNKEEIDAAISVDTETRIKAGGAPALTLPGAPGLLGTVPARGEA